jgi:hypothetical protein
MGRAAAVAVGAADDALLDLGEDGRPGVTAAQHVADVGAFRRWMVMIELEDPRGRLAAVSAGGSRADTRAAGRAARRAHAGATSVPCPRNSACSARSLAVTCATAVLAVGTPAASGDVAQIEVTRVALLTAHGARVHACECLEPASRGPSRGAAKASRRGHSLPAKRHGTEIWGERRDLNARPPGPQPGALTN